MLNKGQFNPILAFLFIVILALAVRVPGLDTFFTADEFLWVDRSRNFLGGLVSRDFSCLLPLDDQTNVLPGQGLECTLRTGHPGVITMWTGALGIWLQWLLRSPDDARTLLEFVQQLSNNPVPLDTIGLVRLPTAILTSIFIGIFFLLLRKLFRMEIAFLAALLLALNPFHIALSRVLHHDALSTIFIIISALALILYFGVSRQRRWLILAGVMAGLAVLTKSTGFFLIAYAGLLALWSMLSRWVRGETTFGQGLGRTLVDGLIWLTAALAAFVAVWPAMWVIPTEAITTIFVIGFKYASGGHAKGVYFLGDVLRDPGPRFYPVSWLFRTHIWGMIGAVSAVGAAIWTFRHRTSHLSSRFKRVIDRLSPRGFDDQTGLLIWLGAFLFFFMIAMIIGEKKQDRYILPVYPLLDIVAAAGLLALIRQQMARRILVILILVVNLALIWPSYPYYFSYYNPLVGGIRTAVRTMTVGWGEGLNLAADYLNNKPDAGNLKVSTWYGSTFGPFFNGQTIRYSDQKGHALGGDYVVFYLNQRQRGLPDEEIWRYFNENFNLDQTISLDGADYAWIFTGPSIGHYVEDQQYTGITELLGWDWRGDLNPDVGPIPAGRTIDYALYWEYLGKSPEEDFFLRLIGPDGRIWSESTSQPTVQYADTAAWRQGQIIEEHGALSILPETPPGAYTLQIGFYTTAPAVTSGELTFPTLNAPIDAPWQTISVTEGPAASNLAGEMMGELALVDSTIDNLDKIDDAINFDLTWVAPDGATIDYQAGYALIDQNRQARWSWETRPLIEFLPTSAWPNQRPLRTQWQLPIDARTPGGSFDLQLQLIDEAGTITPHNLGNITIPGRHRNFVSVVPMMPLDVTFGQAITLKGLDISTDQLLPNLQIGVTQYWQSTNAIDDDYTVFLQLLGPDGQVVAQQDKAPLDGNAPTSTWTPDEFLTDSFTLTLPADLPAGEYRLITGLYQFETAQRLLANTEDGEADFVVLTVWER